MVANFKTSEINLGYNIQLKPKSSFLESFVNENNINFYRSRYHLNTGKINIIFKN